MSSYINIQAAIKNNSQDFTAYLADLKQWEKEIKVEDQKLKEKNADNATMSSNFQESCKNKDQKLIMSNKEKAEELKDEGNWLYSQGKFEEAALKYEEGISLDHLSAALFANRAIVYIKLEKYEKAVSDCRKCLELDSKYVKAYLRRATAYTKLLNFAAAIEDYNEVLKIEPWNKDAKKEIEKLKEKQKKQKASSEKVTARSSSENISCSTSRKDGDIKNADQSEHSNEIGSEDLESKDIVELKFPVKKEGSSLSRTPKVKPVHTKEVSPVRVLKHSRLQEPPPPPRTSHQFYLDWKKVANYDSLAEAYLLSIPGSFFHGVEVDVDQLVEVVHHLNGDSIEPHVIVDLLQSLMHSRGFYLNLAFLEPEQKKEFENVIKKIEDHGLINENIRKIKKSLYL